MKKLNINIIVIILIFLSGCKSQNAYDHPVKYIYEAPYNKQVTIVYPFLEKSDAAKKLGLTMISIYYDEVVFDKYESISATLVNKDDIWKIKLIRQEEIDNIQQSVHYYCYIRKKDGALLYIVREIGEWIGSTDVEEGYFKSSNGND